MLTMSDLAGQTIQCVREMTQDEMDAEGWVSDFPVTVIELSGGTIIYPSRDEDASGPGELFGWDGYDDWFHLKFT